MKKRFLFNQLKEHIPRKQITLLVGARQTGKTTLLRQLEQETSEAGQPGYYFSLENPAFRTLLNEHPDKLFDIIPPLQKNKRTILFIDEIQYLDDPSNFLKYHYDEHSEKLKLVVTGSLGFYIDEKFHDSLAGRKRIFTLNTLSFKEFLHFEERDALASTVPSGKIPAIHRKALDQKLNEYLLYGGYPDVVLEPALDEKRLLLKEIADSYVKKDALEANLWHPDVYMKLLSIIASQPGLFNSTSVASNLGVDRKTIEAYLYVMQKSFHVSVVRPFHKNLTKELRKMPKLYMNDLGLRNHFLNDFSPIGIRKDRGDLLEMAFFRILLDNYPLEDIRFWRTQKGQEVDFIVEESRAYEIKYSENLFKPTKYNAFREQYPDIPLIPVFKDTIIEHTL